MQHLLDRGLLAQENILLPVDASAGGFEPHAEEAKAEAVQKLTNMGLQVIDATDDLAIVSFARPGSSDPAPTLQ